MKILCLTVSLMSSILIAQTCAAYHSGGHLIGPEPVEIADTEEIAPVAHWLFDKPYEPNVVDLISGQIATLINYPQWGNGWAGEQFVHLENHSQAIEIPMGKCRPESGTLALRISPEETDSLQILFAHALDCIENRMALYLDGDALVLGVGDLFFTDIYHLIPAQTYHIALTWDGADYALFVDGRHKLSGVFAGLSQLDPVAYIGNYVYLGNSVNEEGFRGLVHDIQLYADALDKEAIDELFLTHYVRENRPIEFVLVGCDLDGNRINYNIHNLPQRATFNFETQTFAWRLDYNEAGRYEILFSAPNQAEIKVNVVVLKTPIQDWYRGFLEDPRIKGKDKNVHND